MSERDGRRHFADPLAAADTGPDEPNDSEFEPVTDPAAEPEVVGMIATDASGDVVQAVADFVDELVEDGGTESE